MRKTAVDTDGWRYGVKGCFLLLFLGCGFFLGIITNYHFLFRHLLYIPISAGFMKEFQKRICEFGWVIRIRRYIEGNS
jgi:hypothetical protein